MNRKQMILVIESFRQGHMMMDDHEFWTDGKYIYSQAIRIAWKEDDVILLVTNRNSYSRQTKKHIDVCASVLKTIERKSLGVK